MQSFLNSLENIENSANADTKSEDIVSEFTALITDAAKSCQPVYRKKCKRKKKIMHIKKCFDKLCWSLKKVILQCAKQVVNHPHCSILRGKLFTLKKKFKELAKFKTKQKKTQKEIIQNQTRTKIKPLMSQTNGLRILKN